MTDPFADLERELLAAHARKPRRRLPALPGIVMTVVLLGAFVALAGWLGASGDPERAAAPQEKPYTPFEPDSGPAPGRDPDADNDDQPGVTPVDGCAGNGWIPPQSPEPVPAAITERMAIFRAPPGADENTPDPRMTGRQATRVYNDGRRTLPKQGKWGVHAIAAEILPRAQVGHRGDPCAAPEGALEPGVCLVLTERKGAMSACFTLGEIEGGQAFIDADGWIHGFAPDGAGEATAHGTTTAVRDNFFRLPGGPETKVDFQP